jgi:alkylation response protein AidB-like acyl-CoA dehydrogenase
MDADDRALLVASLDATLSGDADAAGNDAALDGLGWVDMLVAEPLDAVAEVFSALGRHAADSSVLDDVVGTAFGLAPGATIVHPAWGHTTPPDPGDGSRRGVAGSRIGAAEVLHVLGTEGIAVVDAAAAEVMPTSPDGRLHPIAVDDSDTDVIGHSEAAFADAVTAARRAIAHQLHGLAVAMLELARQHALDRIQFGRPIGSFQAVRHKLAETLVAIEGAAAALTAADETGDPILVDLARVLAGRAAADAGRHGQQVLAGIGFTRDHDFHRFLFAAIELDGLYGTTAAITKQLGHRLIADRAVPRTVEL